MAACALSNIIEFFRVFGCGLYVIKKETICIGAKCHVGYFNRICILIFTISFIYKFLLFLYLFYVF